MSVADIFTAITEDRPYRKGMNKIQVTEVLTGQVRENKIDGDIVAVLLDNYEYINRFGEGPVKEHERLSGFQVTCLITKQLMKGDFNVNT